jgi:Na+/melibiose symporter-like transporter
MRTYTILLVVLIVVAAGAVAFQAFKSRSRVVERRDVNIQEIQQKCAADEPLTSLAWALWENKNFQKRTKSAGRTVVHPQR